MILSHAVFSFEEHLSKQSTSVEGLVVVCSGTYLKEQQTEDVAPELRVTETRLQVPFCLRKLDSPLSVECGVSTLLGHEANRYQVVALADHLLDHIAGGPSIKLLCPLIERFHAISATPRIDKLSV
jgi:hypothetical protein